MTFQSLNLPSYLIKSIESLSYEAPTEIQKEAIPHILESKDVIAEAQTGSGKTAAFSLPIIKRLNDLPTRKSKKNIQVLVITPTRELAVQVASSFKKYANFSPRVLTIKALIGGEVIDQQIKALQKGVDIAVATPGRLLELIDLKKIDLSNLEILVLDEADKILDLGFSEEMDLLLEKLPSKRQNLLFSATIAKKIVDLSAKFLKEPINIKIESDNKSLERIKQRVIEVDPDKRRMLLQSFIKEEKWDYTIVFVASKRAAKNLANKLQKDSVKADSIHGDLNQEERTGVLARFKKKEFNVLIATDIAARGIDIENLSHVVNYDLPRSPADYVHRIGRTGRAGRRGDAISFINHETMNHFKLIEKRTGIKLEREQLKGYELSEKVDLPTKGKAPVKGKRKSKKDKLREAQQKLKS